eukprot:scaffold4429_cov81-Skeletonema_dohrnii-CCMP3373.AAC.18
MIIVATKFVGGGLAVGRAGLHCVRAFLKFSTCVGIVDFVNGDPAAQPKDNTAGGLHPLSLGDICHAALMYMIQYVADGGAQRIITDRFGSVIGHGLCPDVIAIYAYRHANILADTGADIYNSSLSRSNLW